MVSVPQLDEIPGGGLLRSKVEGAVKYCTQKKMTKNRSEM